MIPTNWKEWVYGIAIVAMVWSGWYMRGVWEDHKHVAEMKAAQAETQRIQHNYDVVSTAYEALRASKKSDIDAIRKQLEKAHVENPHSCPVPISIVQAIRAVRSGSATGKPHG